MPLYQTPEKRPNFPELEQRMLELWEQGDIFNKLRAKNADGERWPFMDGPITANNPMGVHHAWGRSLKDMFHRYHAMNGKNSCGIRTASTARACGWRSRSKNSTISTSKRDIETYGVAKFVNDCKDRVRKFSEVQTEQSKRLGYWMDWDNSYYTMSEENNYTIWSVPQALPRARPRLQGHRRHALVPALRGRPVADGAASRATSGSSTCRCLSASTADRSAG